MAWDAGYLKHFIRIRKLFLNLNYRASELSGPDLKFKISYKLLVTVKTLGTALSLSAALAKAS